MVSSLLVRGMLVGLLAGLVAFLVGTVVGEPQVDRAIAIEVASEQAGAEAATTGHEHGEDATVSRVLQRSLGLLTGTAGYGLAVGGLFGLAYAATMGRLGRLSPRASSALLAGAGFVSVVLVPFLKYPANPPAIGDPDTINARTAYFFVLMAVSVGVAVLSVRLGRSLVQRWGAWNAALATAGTYVAAMLLVCWLMPVVDEVPADFPPTLLYDFRLASIVVHLALWTTLGLAFGALTQRSQAPAFHTTR
jgi:predicted cobalt transporter CbtA